MEESKASDSWKLWHGDAVQCLSCLTDASVDLVITDPAYQSLEKHRVRAKPDGTVVHRGRVPRLKKWFPIFPNERFSEFFKQVYRVLAHNRHFYMMCDQETAFLVKPIAEDAGFKFWKPIIWDKQKIGMGYHYRGQYEMVLFFEKGKRNLTDLSVPDVLSIPRHRDGYPTQKPTALTDILVRQSAAPGEIVCDPFCGSGSTGVSALNHGCRFLGTDVNEEALSISHQRLSETWQRQRDISAPGA